MSLHRKVKMSTLQFLIISMTLVCIAAYMTNQTENSFTSNPTRNTLIRSQKGKDMKKHMNLSKDPCDNFYEYACGNWVTFHHSPKDIKENTTPFSLLEQKVMQDLHKILMEEVTLDDKTIHRKVKEFYKSCMNAERNGLMQEVFFSEFITNNKGFPAVPGNNWLLHHANYNWQEVVATLQQNYDMNILIGLDIDLNYLNIYENSIYLTEPSTLIPAKLCSKKGTKNIDIREKEYEDIERNVAENLKQWLTIRFEEARRIAADIITFEYELCSAMRDKETEISPNYTRKTLSEFTHQFNDSIDFKVFVTESLGIAYNKPVFMAAPDYYFQLIRTLHRYNSTTVANYIMYHALSKLSFPLNDHPNRRPAFCVNLIKKYFPKIIGYMYFRKYGSKDIMNEIKILFEEIKKSFQNNLKNNWIEQGISRLGLAKLEEINFQFPFYEKIQTHNISIDKEHFWKNLEQVMSLKKPLKLSRAFEMNMPKPKNEIESYDMIFKYAQPDKKINSGLALLQAPFYQIVYPQSYVYATLGQMIGQSLATAFDDLHWDLLTAESANWDQAFEMEYRQRSECYRQQLSNYISNEPNYFYNSSIIRNLMTVSSGLNVAFNAYLYWLATLNPNNNFTILNKETLSDLDFTNTQLFFISYAQMYCRAERYVQPKILVSPLINRKWEDFLVNGPLRNFDEFSREFGCQIGTEMNPPDKCRHF